MNEPSQHLTADEMAELEAFLAARLQGEEPATGQVGFPSGVAGELLELAQRTHPDPVFAARLERRLRRAAEMAAATRKANSLSGWLPALWHTLTQPERKPAMKRLTAFALAGTLLLAILFVAIRLYTLQPSPGEIALVTPPAQTSAPVEVTPGVETQVSPTPEPIQTQPSVAINFTPQPLPSQPPVLPSIAQAYGPGYGGGGGAGLPAGMPISLAVELPAGPAEVQAYYRLENTPLTPEEAGQLATAWGLDARLYLPAWMLAITPDQIERSYYAIDGMQKLSIWNGELSFLDLIFSPVYEGRQYPQAGLPPADQALAIATQYLTERGQLEDTFLSDLSRYNYGIVNFYRLLDGLRLDNLAAEVKINPQGQVGSAWVSREEYQPVGSYPVISAQQAWEQLLAGGANDNLRISYYPARDGNPQYWGRYFAVGEIAHLFGRPTLLAAAETGAFPYLELNNLILTGDLPGLIEYLQSNQGYIHVWGSVREQDGERQLLLSAWEPFDEFSSYFNGTVRRTAEGNFLELSDGRSLRLPDLPAGVPSDLPVYANGGQVDDTLEWFTLQVHPSDEGQLPPDLSQVSAVIDRVELVYLAPDLNNLSPEQALDPPHRMLLPAWRFSGRMIAADGSELIYLAYVGAVVTP